MKKYNFNAGPSMLPREVIEKTAQQCWFWSLADGDQPSCQGFPARR